MTDFLLVHLLNHSQDILPFSLAPGSVEHHAVGEVLSQEGLNLTQVPVEVLWSLKKRIRVVPSEGLFKEVSELIYALSDVFFILIGCLSAGGQPSLSQVHDFLY